MHFTKAKMAIITNCLLTDFSHGSIAGILLALVHSTEPTRFNSQRQNALHPQPSLATTHEQVMQTKFFEHLDELRSWHYAALLAVTSVGHQTAELQANILAVSAYDTQSTGHALHESKNGHHY